MSDCVFDVFTIADGTAASLHSAGQTPAGDQWVQEGSQWHIASMPKRDMQHVVSSSSGGQLESRIADLAGNLTHCCGHDVACI